MRVERKNYIVDYNHTRMQGSVQVIVRRFPATSFKSAKRRAFAALRLRRFRIVEKDLLRSVLIPRSHLVIFITLNRGQLLG